MIESRRQQFLAALIGNWDQKFDPATGLSAAGSCGIRESLFYALVLLEQGEHSRLGRAEAILRRSIDTTCPRKPDMWLTLALVWIWSRYRQRFSPDLQKRIANVFCDLTESPLEWFKPQDKVAIQFPNTEDCLRQLVFSACMEASGQSVQNQFFPPSPPPPLEKSVQQNESPVNELLSLLIISGMTAVLSNASIKRAMRKLERSVWKTLAGWLDHIIACPPEEPSPPARIENLDTLGIVLEKGTRGKLKIANPSPNENLPSEAYLFALISDIEAPAAIAARLMQTESIWPSFVHPVHSNKILGEVFFPTSNMPAIATQIRPCLAPP